MPMWFPRVNEIIRQIGSHNLLTTPSRAALADSTLRPLIDQYLAGVGVDGEQRSRRTRRRTALAGTALGSGNDSCGRVDLGAVGRNLACLRTLNDRARAKRLVDRCRNEELDPL